MPPATSLDVELPKELQRLFHPLFQQGVEVEVETGCSIKEILTEQFGLSADYLAERITTLFLNSKAVDDAATAIVQDRAVLALSGAMPGLVGATMRSGGHLSAMRGAMTYSDDGQTASRRQGVIKLKLFNLLLDEVGPRLLQRGILLTTEQFKEFMESQPEGFRFRNSHLDGKPLTVNRVTLDNLSADPQQMIRFTVSFSED